MDQSEYHVRSVKVRKSLIFAVLIFAVHDSAAHALHINAYNAHNSTGLYL